MNDVRHERGFSDQSDVSFELKMTNAHLIENCGHLSPSCRKGFEETAGI